MWTVHRTAAECTYKVGYCKSREGQTFGCSLGVYTAITATLGQSLGNGTGLRSLHTDFTTEVKKIPNRMLMEESKKRNRQ